MTGQPSILAAEFPPSVEEFFPPSLAPWGGDSPWFTRITLMVWIATAAIIIFFLVAYRNPKMVPGRLQWIAESIYGFGRNGIAREMIGPEGLRFASYLTTLFVFILVMNFFAILPFFQISPNSHFAFPATLAVLTYVLFNYVGIRKHGVVGYFKGALVPPAPWYILWLLIPIEFISTFLIRPVSLSVRLFANMFAGHMLLVVFSLGAVYLLTAGGIMPLFGAASFLMALVMTFFELLVIVLQAYVFVVLTATYLNGAVEPAH